MFGYQILGFGAHASGDCGAPVSGTDLKTSLALWLAMDEASGDPLDSHTNSYDFTVVTLDPLTATAKVGDNARLYVAASNRASGRANAAEAWRMGTSDMTIAFWVKFTAFSTGVIQTIIGCGATSNTDEGYTINVLDDGTGMQVKFGNGTTRVNHLFDFDTALSTGTWYYIIVEWDRDGDAAVWKNDIKESTTTDISSLSASDIASDQDLQIGRKPTGGLSLDAALDEIPIYNRLLTCGEKTWLYNDDSGRAYSELG